MSEALNQYNASAGDDHKYIGLKIFCDDTDVFDTRYLIESFDDVTATLEDGTEVTFEASGMSVNLPKSESGSEMELQFGIDNVTGEAREMIDAARKAGATVYITLYVFMASDLSAPAETPVTFRVTTASTTRTNCTVNAGIGYLSNSAWPRNRFTLDYSPGLAYT